MKCPRIALVEWDDAHMCGNWIDGDPAPPSPEVVFTIGFVVHMTRTHLVLVQSVADNQHGNRVQIPRRMVRRLQWVPYAGDDKRR